MKSATLRKLTEETQAPYLIPRSLRGDAEAQQRKLGKGVLAGVIGGFIGTVMMTQFQNVWSKASEALQSRTSTQEGQGKQKQQGEQEDEDATMKAAGKIAHVAGRQLSREQKKNLGPVVHYMFGTLQGALYGGVIELTRTRGGLLPALTFGAGLFVVADEIAVPALGLSGKPTESPLSSHLYGLAAHLVYGLSTEVARRGLRAAL